MKSEVEKMVNSLKDIGAYTTPIEVLLADYKTAEDALDRINDVLQVYGSDEEATDGVILDKVVHILAELGYSPF